MVPPPVPPQADPQRPSEWVYETVADLSGDTSSDPPIDGLLSSATSPEGDRLYSLQVATGDHALILRSFPYDAGTRLAPSDGSVVFRLDHPFVHSGGSMAVMSSGDLVVSVGAFERPGEPRGLQNPDGSILRVPEAIARDPGPRRGRRARPTLWRVGCAIPGGSRSTCQPAICGSETSGRGPTRR